VTHAFLRSLAKLDLAKSKIGRLSMIMPAVFRPSQPANGEPPERQSTNGDAPERQPVSSTNQP
jgi:hypothetical protein